MKAARAGWANRTTDPAVNPFESDHAHEEIPLHDHPERYRVGMNVTITSKSAEELEKSFDDNSLNLARHIEAAVAVALGIETSENVAWTLAVGYKAPEEQVATLSNLNGSAAKSLLTDAIESIDTGVQLSVNGTTVELPNSDTELPNAIKEFVESLADLAGIDVKVTVVELSDADA